MEKNRKSGHHNPGSTCIYLQPSLEVRMSSLFVDWHYDQTAAATFSILSFVIRTLYTLGAKLLLSGVVVGVVVVLDVFCFFKRIKVFKTKQRKKTKTKPKRWSEAQK